MAREMRCFGILLFLHIFLGSLTLLHAQQGKRFGIILDNDMFFMPKNEDRDYTGGIRIDLPVWNERKNPLWYPLTMLDILFSLEDHPIAPSQEVFRSSLYFQMFTPDDLHRTEPIYHDRPYSSVMIYSFQKDRFNPVSSIRTLSFFEVGILGFPMAKDIQAGIHFFLRKMKGSQNPHSPKGWHNQISSFGEPTARYGMEIHKDLDRLTWRSKENPNLQYFNLSTQFSASMGYLTQVSGGAHMRLGFMGFGEMGNKDLFIFMGTDQYIVLYNALLQGQLLESTHHFSFNELNHIVNRWNLGIEYKGKNWTLGYTLFSRSAEFQIMERDRHYWGSVKVVFQRN